MNGEYTSHVSRKYAGYVKVRNLKNEGEIAFLASGIIVMLFIS